MLMTGLYFIYEKYKIDTKKVGSPLVETVYKNMLQREDSRLRNEILLAAMYLDLRFSILLEGPTEKKAARHLQILHNRLVLEKQSSREADNCNTLRKPPSERDDSAEAEFARKIAEKFRQKKRRLGRTR